MFVRNHALAFLPQRKKKFYDIASRQFELKEGEED
jgi:hypothetical protein